MTLMNIGTRTVPFSFVFSAINLGLLILFICIGLLFRHVVLPPEVAKLLPKNRLLSEVSSNTLSPQFLCFVRD